MKFAHVSTSGRCAGKKCTGSKEKQTEPLTQNGELSTAEIPYAHEIVDDIDDDEDCGDGVDTHGKPG